MPDRLISPLTRTVVRMTLLTLTLHDRPRLREARPVEPGGLARDRLHQTLPMAGYFMHLRYRSPLPRLVAAGGLLWLAILLLGTMDDFKTPSWLGIPGK